MSNRLIVDMGQGRKESVAVMAHTTLGQVKDEVCKRRKLNPEVHALRHQRHMLEASLTVRYSGLASNATLELVASDGVVCHGACTVALQLECGGRETGKLDTSSSLAEVISKLAPGGGGGGGGDGGGGDGGGGDGGQPCLVYMGRPVTGADLVSTLLLDLGVTPGASALLRLSYTHAAPAAPTAKVPAAPTTAPSTPTMPEPTAAPAASAAPTATLAAPPARPVSATVSSAQATVDTRPADTSPSDARPPDEVPQLDLAEKTVAHALGGVALDSRRGPTYGGHLSINRWPACSERRLACCARRAPTKPPSPPRSHFCCFT